MSHPMMSLKNRLVFWAMTTVVSIMASFTLMVILTGYIVWSDIKHEERTARLASAIGALRDHANHELRIAGFERNALKDANRKPWSRDDMLVFCQEAARLNSGFKCPDVVEIAPGLNIPFTVPLISPFDGGTDKPQG